MSFRKERVRDLLIGFLSEQVRRMNDPRLELVSISAVDLSGDMRYATVFWSLLGSVDPNCVAATGKALDGAKGFLKRKIGEELELKFVPDIRFEYDDSAIVGARIDQLLDEQS